MKTFAAATFVALAAIATAQVPDLPSCSLNCFFAPLTSDGCQNIEDSACHCQKAESLFAAITPCIKEACTPAEEADVISKVSDLCAANGVTVALPEATTATVTSEVASTTTEAASTTTEAASTTTATSEMYTSTIIASSVSMMPTPTGNGTAPTAVPSPSPSEFPGAAARVSQAIGALGAAALAMFVL